MDTDIRFLHKRVLEENNDTDRYKLRLSQWRQGVSIKPLPGDTIEFRGQGERTRGILINKYPIKGYPRNAPQWWINRSYWIIKRDNSVYAFLNDSRLKIIIVELALPGAVAPSEPIPFSPIFLALSRCWDTTNTMSRHGYTPFQCTLPYKHRYQHYNDNFGITWERDHEKG